MPTDKAIYEAVPIGEHDLCLSLEEPFGFDEQGNVQCPHCDTGIPQMGGLGGRHANWEACAKVEWLCELMAAILLVPNTVDYQERTREEWATAYSVEPWVLDFRNAIGDLRCFTDS